MIKEQKIRIINQFRKTKKQAKIQKEINNLDEDKKNLSKRLEQVQQSIRAMWHIDKRVKNEKQLIFTKKKRAESEFLLNKTNLLSRDKK